MKSQRNLGMIFLAIWLILTGLLPFLRVSLPFQSVILPLLALLAGVLILFGR
jgi:uncharacterized membrane protein